MEADDYLIGTYRTHGHAIARGTDPKRVMAELFGRVDGTSGGRGGSMHVFDGERRFMGGYGVVGGNLPIAAGLALASDYRGDPSATVCMFGDGASNTGNFGETMNLAALWKLPIVFIVENNLYGMGTHVERAAAGAEIYRRAEVYGIPSRQVDGMDVLAVRENVSAALNKVRKGNGPAFIEALTYRFRGHSMADPELYRNKEEVAHWRTLDPIERFESVLTRARVLGKKQIDASEESIEREIDEAVRYADESPFPAAESLAEHVYADAATDVGADAAEPAAAPERTEKAA